MNFFNVDISTMNAYQMFFYFLFYAFLGWAIEVCYMAKELDSFENRGFLLGPINPIYGFGVLIIIKIISPIKSIVIMYLVACAVCTAFEFLIGVFLEKTFKQRWWSYDHERFNFKGIICLKVSLLWGFGCVCLLKIVHPLLVLLVDAMPEWLGISLIVFFSVIIFVDTLTSGMRALHTKYRIKFLDKFTKKVLLGISTFIGKRCARATLYIKHKIFKDYSKHDVVETGTTVD